MVQRQQAIIGWKPFSASPHVASARLRCSGPLALLREQGLPVELYRSENQRQYRVVILQKLYDAEHQELAKRLQAHGTHVVFDLCDNYLYTANLDAGLGARAENIRRMLDIADVVTVPTATLAEYLPRPATIVRDGVEPHRSRNPFADLLIGWRRDYRLELIWFGTWGNPNVTFGMRDLLEIGDVLQDLAARIPVRLTVVSNSRKVYAEWIAPMALPTRYLEWKNHAHLCALLPRHDACLIPVRPNPYTVCKSANRLALSLYLSVPVIATGIPSYREFAPFCTLDDWKGGLRAAAAGGSTWKSRAAGRSYVLKNHMMEHAAAEWGRLLEDILPLGNREKRPKADRSETASQP